MLYETGVPYYLILYYDIINGRNKNMYLNDILISDNFSLWLLNPPTDTCSVTSTFAFTHFS